MIDPLLRKHAAGFAPKDSEPLRERGARRGAFADASTGPADLPPHGAARPRTRGDCANAPRPCPWTSCKWHLGFSGCETCSLDVADRGGSTLAVVAQAVGLTRERIRQIETRALARFWRGIPLEAFGIEVAPGFTPRPVAALEIERLKNEETKRRRQAR